ncbi:Uncharacterised protein [Candidatus Norongarragalina meridionalis]|nr:Uncharacterised protein [Candidatus Norongarragalina meridionalis]
MGLARLSVFLLAFAFFSLASALGISHQGLVNIDYTPGFNESYGYAAVNGAGNEDVAFARYVCGELSPYVNLNPEAGEQILVQKDCNAISSGVTAIPIPHVLPGGGIKYFSYTVSLPQATPSDLKPGINQAFLGFMQVVSSTGAIGGRVAVQIPITVYVPYPGKYVELELTAANAKKGEPIAFSLRAENKGTETVTAHATIKIYDSKNAELKTLDAGSAEIGSKNSSTFTASLDTADMEAASYKAKASVEYGGSAPATAEATFKVGELAATVNITNIENAYVGKTAKIYVEAESMWGDPIENAYVEITAQKDDNVYGPFKTPSETLPAWGKKQFSAVYWDVPSNGRFLMNATLHYDDKTAVASRTVDVTEATPTEEATVEATATPTAPQGRGTDVMPIVLGILAICVLGALLYWLLKRKPKEDFAISLNLSGTKLSVSIGNTTDKEGKAKGFVEILNQHGSAVATVPLPEAAIPAFGTKTITASLDSVPLEAGSYTLKVALGINGKKHEATQPLAVS